MTVPEARGILKKAKGLEDGKQWCGAAPLRLRLARSSPDSEYNRSRNLEIGLSDLVACAGASKCATPEGKAQHDEALTSGAAACAALHLFDATAQRTAGATCHGLSATERCPARAELPVRPDVAVPPPKPEPKPEPVTRVKPELESKPKPERISTAEPVKRLTPTPQPPDITRSAPKSAPTTCLGLRPSTWRWAGGIVGTLALGTGAGFNWTAVQTRDEHPAADISSDMRVATAAYATAGVAGAALLVGLLCQEPEAKQAVGQATWLSRDMPLATGSGSALAATGLPWLGGITP